MGKIRDVLVAESGCPTLDGMGTTEDVVDGLLGISTLFEIQQAAFDFVEAIGALRHENLADFFHPLVHASSGHNRSFPQSDAYFRMRLIISMSLSGGRGFAFHPVAPVSLFKVLEELRQIFVAE